MGERQTQVASFSSPERSRKDQNTLPASAEQCVKGTASLFWRQGNQADRFRIVWFQFQLHTNTLPRVRAIVHLPR